MPLGRKGHGINEPTPGWEPWRPPWWPLAVLVGVVTALIALFVMIARSRLRLGSGTWYASLLAAHVPGRLEELGLIR